MTAVPPRNVELPEGAMVLTAAEVEMLVRDTFPIYVEYEWEVGKPAPELQALIDRMEAGEVDDEQRGAWLTPQQAKDAAKSFRLLRGWVSDGSEAARVYDGLLSVLEPGR